MTPDHISGSASDDNARDVEQQTRNGAREKSENSFVLVDLNDGSEDRRVLCLSSDELRHHSNGNDVEGGADDGTGCMNDHIPLQLSLESLVIFVFLHVVAFFFVHSLKSKLISYFFTEMRAQEVSDESRRQSSIASIQTIHALDVRN